MSAAAKALASWKRGRRTVYARTKQQAVTLTAAPVAGCTVGPGVSYKALFAPPPARPMYSESNRAGVPTPRSES